MDKEKRKRLLTEKQILTDKLVHTYNELDDYLYDVTHSKDFSQHTKDHVYMVQNHIFKLLKEIMIQDYRYHVPIKDLEKEEIVFLYD